MIVSLSATRLSVKFGSPSVRFDQPGDIAVDLGRRQPRAEQPADEQPAEQRHAERFDQPVDADGHGNAAPLLRHPVQRPEIDLDQHRHDHQPDQHRDRDVDLREVHAAERLERRGQQLAEHDAGDDAERDP
jgi:hypothetical protein